jgi:anti-sigma factor RsiW
MSCRETTMSLGVYLLGALDPVERAEVEAHLDTCESCRQELAELAALPSVLDQLSIEDFALEPPEVPDDLFERVAAQARAEQAAHDAGSRRNYRRLLVAAAAVLVITAGSIASVAGLRSHHEVYKVQSGPVQMAVALDAQTTGTALRVTVRGLPQNEHCRLIAVAKDGTRDVAGRWDATYAGVAQQTGSTSIPQSELAQLVLLGNGGKTLATVNV